MCLKFEKPTPKLTEYEISPAELTQLGLNSFPTVRQEMWDNRYWYVSLVDWGTILRDVMVNLPKYTAEKFDCEDFGKQVSCRVDAKYMLNTCAIAIGASPMGRHGYNVFIARVNNVPKLYILEPQTADIWAPEDGSGYIPDTILWG